MYCVMVSVCEEKVENLERYANQNPSMQLFRGSIYFAFDFGVDAGRTVLLT